MHRAHPRPSLSLALRSLSAAGQGIKTVTVSLLIPSALHNRRISPMKHLDGCPRELKSRDCRLNGSAPVWLAAVHIFRFAPPSEGATAAADKLFTALFAG